MKKQLEKVLKQYIKENIIVEWLEYNIQEKDYINYRTYLKMIS